MKTLLIVGASALALVSLSACSTLGVGGLNGGSPDQMLTTLDKINTAAAQHCSGDGNIDWNPPLPPTGSLHVRCVIGTPQVSPELLKALQAAGFVGNAPPTPAPPAAPAPPAQPVAH